MIVAAIAVVTVAMAAFAYWRQADDGAAVAAQANQQPAGAAALPGSPKVPALADMTAAAPLEPHPQQNLPPLQFPGYAPPRPPDVIKAVYRFAAEHPEVLSYVPCFCGCERAGHRGNEDCFVRARAANGDVVEWEEHGMECTVCIDVAQRSMQMHSAGASARDIRAAIELEWAPRYPNRTPTPMPR
jgi:hypothetical protein